MSPIQEFQEAVWSYYARHVRTMPWRSDPSPYHVLVSELMLQQTQVARVIPKFEAFMETFPTVDDLAAAPLSDVLVQWQGLGYNRRAKFLHEAAKKIMDEYGGVFPSTLDALVSLPGVGKNTAGAILAYAFDDRAIFVETNIRTVLFYHFFKDGALVDDKELISLLEQTLPEENYREWYWALMDYGTYLKREAGGRLDQSRHYKKQAPLKGSIREVRGQIIKALAGGRSTEVALKQELQADERFSSALDGLIKDGLVVRTGLSLGLTAE